MAAPEDGPSTGARGQDLRQGQAAETYAEQRARANAMRGEATAERGSGAVRGEQKDPSVRGAERMGGAIDPSVLAAFTQDLLAGSEMGEMDGGLDAGEEMEDLEFEPEAPDQERRVKKSRGARPPRQSTGGVDDSEDGEPDEEGEAAPVPIERSAKWPRVSAKKRVRALDLPMLLAIGSASRVLVGWQASTVERLVLALPSRSFHLLWRAHDALPGPEHRVLLLQALAAHRRDDDLTRLAERLADVSDTDIAAWTAQRIATRDPDDRAAPGDAPSDLGLLMEHYDPCAYWLDEAAPTLQCEEPWPIPQWLRGAAPEPMELCAVAFLQAGLGVFATENDGDDEGSNDPLAAAIEVHGDAHPALARWGVTLLARADSRQGLDQAADALLRARSLLGR